VPFYVCPGTSTWCSLAGRTDNALANLLNAAENGLKYGAIGYLNTDWGDLGHWQAPPMSYLGFAAGAAFAWALDANRAMDVPAVVSRFAFDDPSGAMGRVAFDLGNIYCAPGLPETGNGSALFWALQLPLEKLKGRGLPAEVRQGVLDAIDAAMAPLDQAEMARPDADLIRREYRNTARALRHAVRRVELAEDPGNGSLCAELKSDLNGFIAEYRDLWLARSRPGGLDDSAARFERALLEYK
jgi:hypothetical protein